MATISEAFAAAIAHQRAGRLDAAEQIYRELVAVPPAQADALHLLGAIALQRAQYEKATELIEQAIELNNQEASYHLNLGGTYQARGMLEQAAMCYQRAVDLKPADARGLIRMGRLCHLRGATADAILHLERALEQQPESVDALSALGAIATEQGLLDDAVGYYRHAARVKPNDAAIHDSLGSVLLDAGEFDNALNSFQNALDLEPDLALAHYHQSLVLLMKGDFERGWAEHEWRWKCHAMSSQAAKRPWDGSPLTGKTILLDADQGAGDMIQFVRYVALVKERAGTVLLRCPKSLVSLFRRCCGIDHIIDRDEPLPLFDCEAYLTSLPSIFRTTLENVPNEVPYLFADRALVERWRKALPDSGCRVGIAWQGNPGFKDDSRRSIPLVHFAPLGRVPGVRLISLQKFHGTEQLNQMKHLFDVVDLTAGLDELAGAFMDTAAIMMHLDLVVTSDTSIAHLAGALGVPVWVALPFVADWRWMLQRSDSPWYPTMRLFRQSKPGNWQVVFDDIARELGTHFRSHCS